LRPLLARTLNVFSPQPPVHVYDEHAGISMTKSGIPVVASLTARTDGRRARRPREAWLFETITKVSSDDPNDTAGVWADVETRTSTDWPDPEPTPRPPGLETKASSDWPDPEPRPQPIPPRDDLATGVVSF
jgi:hypothetical protein